MPFTALAIGAGVGGLKDLLVDQPREAKQRALAAATQRYSPWTGLTANQIPLANSVGDVLGGAGQGAAVGASIQNSNAVNNYLNAKTASGSFSGVPNLTFNSPGMQLQPVSSPWGSIGGSS